MTAAPAPHPLVYELNVRCLLQELAASTGGAATLAGVPDARLQEWAELGFTHVWLMGAWTTGPRSRAQAQGDAHLRAVVKDLLGRWSKPDVVGSPYAVAAYRVPRGLGGEAGLAAFRRRLHAHGLKLLLDFVPNHVGLDHPWVSASPERFVACPSGAPESLVQESPGGPVTLAHGKDPNFAAWADTVQLDHRRADTRAAVIAELVSVAARCDGVRCDMAMLQLREVFARTWAQHPVSGPMADGEFWSEAIRAVRARVPDCLLLAEAYWGLEPRLVDLGFDYVYDKTFYDHVVARRAAEVPRYLLVAGAALGAHAARFLENHDEARIAERLPFVEHRAAALLLLGLPGLRLLHEGQLTGARRHVPVQLGRRPVEPVDPAIAGLYDGLLRALNGSAVGHGRGEVLPPLPAWPGNPTAESLVAMQWQAVPGQFDLVVVNLAAHRSQGYVRLTVPDLARSNWRMEDLLGDAAYERYGDDLQNAGLYLDVAEHGAQLFRFRPLA
jgi:glycosidase